MRKYLSTIPLVFLLSFLIGCQKPVEEVAEEPAIDIEAEKEAIVSRFRQIIARFEELQKEGDISTIADFYANAHTEDAVLMFPGEPAVDGRENVFAYIKDNFSKVLSEYVFEFPIWNTEELIIVDSWAFHRFNGIAVLRPKKGGESIELDRKYLDIWKRSPEGDWKIARHIYNRNK
jgi:ketosteroid isomerase-like protein